MESTDQNFEIQALTLQKNPDGSYTIGGPTYALDTTGVLIVDKGTIFQRLENCRLLVAFAGEILNTSAAELHELKKEMGITIGSVCN